MKLISMTSFVLQRDITDIKQRDSIVKYANFLKQPLKLEMFVPLNEYGEILINPFACDEDAGSEKELKQIQYNNAKEKVLFENAVFFETKPHFNTKRILISLNNNHTFRIYNQFNYRDGSIEKQYFPNNENLTIENLIQYNLQLTKNAVKQIGL